MEWTVVIHRELSYSHLLIKADFIGENIVVCIMGGAQPHIGCTVQAIPRKSLSGDGSISSTSSVMNLTGHKDEVLCRRLAEQICKEMNTVVVCCGGFHIDYITPEQITEVRDCLDEICMEAVQALKARAPR